VVKKNFNEELNCYIHEIFTGECHATAGENVIYSTLLGSCISVCLKDSCNGVAGINHFMLPGKFSSNGRQSYNDVRYGWSAMETLIREMERLGARREHLKAKIFGGGEVLEVNLNNIARANVDFINSYIAEEKIPVEALDVGGNYGRKLFYYTRDFTVYIKQIKMERNLKETVVREKKFLQQVRQSYSYTDDT